MKIAILIPVRSGGSLGYIKHLTEIVPKMLQNKVVERISIFVPEKTLIGLHIPGVDLHLVAHDDYKTGFREMGELAEAGEYDVALCTTARAVPLLRCPIIYMVQNIEPIQKPSYSMPLKWRVRLWLLRREHAMAFKRATGIIAISNFSKSQICQRFYIQPKDVHVVYHGFDPGESASSVKPDLSIPKEGFIFSAGSIVPYRGYEDIIRALAVLLSSGAKILPVIFAGSVNSYAKSYERSLRSLARSLKVEDFIIWAGGLQRNEMTWCYQNARLFIQTSRAEAFPNILVEAMGHGCVSVSCDHPPMPEIFQDAALYYPTGDSDALAQRIKMVLEMNQEETEKRHTITRLRSSFFSWDKCANDTLEVLQQVVQGCQK